MTNPDTEIDTARECVLTSGDVCDWNGAPVAFRFAADRARMAKLVRNCDQLEFWSYAFDHGLTLQKGPMAELVKGMDDDARVACIFNGLNLMVFGPIEGNT